MKAIELFKNIISNIKDTHFLKDAFVWAMFLLGVLVNASFFYYVRLKTGSFSDVTSSLSASGYEFISNGENLYKIPLLVAVLSLLNIFGSKVVYNYDILASYILVISVPALNILSFFGAFVFLSFSV